VRVLWVRARARYLFSLWKQNPSRRKKKKGKGEKKERKKDAFLSLIRMVE
jgi:hypothetical protein